MVNANSAENKEMRERIMYIRILDHIERYERFKKFGRLLIFCGFLGIAFSIAYVITH